jgi:S-adenosylmethionine hydrolase
VRAVQYLPDASIVMAVVDPGVGTDRRLLGVEVAGGILLGPDNGLLAPAVAMAGGAERAVVLTDPAFHLSAIGATFAGRDVFAPVAAHLCNGVDLFELGEPIESELLMPGIVPLAREEAGLVLAEVLWVDQFGNCQLNVGPDEIAPWGDRLRITFGDPGDQTVRSVTVVSAFGEIGTGAVGLVADSSGMLAIALDRRSAAEELSIGPGDQVVLSPLEADDGPSPVTSPVTIRPAAPRATG